MKPYFSSPISCNSAVFIFSENVDSVVQISTSNRQFSRKCSPTYMFSHNLARPLFSHWRAFPLNLLFSQPCVLLRQNAMLGCPVFHFGNPSHDSSVFSFIISLFWLGMLLDGLICSQMLPCALRCFKMLSDALRCSQMPPDASIYSSI